VCNSVDGFQNSETGLFGIADFGMRIADLRDFRFEIAECRLMKGARRKAQGARHKAIWVKFIVQSSKIRL
jgi:hypothetical protein